jgi:hypothetical protein
VVHELYCKVTIGYNPRHDGLVVFVPNTAPGDLVSCALALQLPAHFKSGSRRGGAGGRVITDYHPSEGASKNRMQTPMIHIRICSICFQLTPHWGDNNRIFP